jgi:predicted N-acetyltransferase YhbS
MSEVLVRPEVEADYRASEEVIREAFWNTSQPGADEHYLLSKMRGDKEYIKELGLVATIDDTVVGMIAYMRSTVVNDDGRILNVATFGPIGVLPSHQGRGVARLLIERSFSIAKRMGYVAVVIFGYQRYYGRLGFRAGEVYDITNSTGEFANSLLVYPLAEPNPLKTFGGGRFIESELFRTLGENLEFTGEGMEEYEATFPPKVKEETPSQAEFRVLIKQTYKCTQPLNIL